MAGRSEMHAWRVVHPENDFGRASIRPANQAGRWHEKGDRVIYAWQTAELAAMSMGLLTGALVPTELRRERLDLPQAPNLFSSYFPVDNATNATGAPMSRTSGLLREMKSRSLLGLWIPSRVFPTQCLLLLDPTHAMFDQVCLSAEVVMNTRSGRMSLSEVRL